MILTLLLLATPALAQTGSIDMLGALDIVREHYGEDVFLTGGRYDEANQCWRMELDDITRVCISDTTGEFVDIDEAAAGSSQPESPGLAQAAVLFVVALFIFIATLRMTSAPGPQMRNESDTRLSLPVQINGITRVLTLIAGYLALQSVVMRWIQSTWEDAPRAFDVFVRVININLEQSVPTWYATILLVGAAGLAFIIARSKWPNHPRRMWLGLALIFTYLSIDEAVSIHEEFTIPLRETLGTSGIFYFAWIIVGLGLVAIVGLIYLRFVLRLPAPVRNLIIMAGALFVGGAVGVEAISAALYEVTGTTAIYSTIGTVEELFEMLGVIVFIRALLIHYQISSARRDTPADPAPAA